MQPWPLLLLCLCLSARAESYTADRVIGETVVLSGEVVNLTCHPQNSSIGFNWFYFNHTLDQYHFEQHGLRLTFKATVEKSGTYLCSKEPKQNNWSQAVNLTIVERLAPLTVWATPSQSAIMEVVTLHCNASTSPPATNWSWYRNHKIVAFKRDWDIARPEKSELYSCKGQSLVMGIQQEQDSPTVALVVFPPTLRLEVNFGLAGFGLSLLACLLAALLWFTRWRRGAEFPALQEATSSSAKAKGLTEAPCDGPPHDVEYMNMGRNENYTNLVTDSMADIYSSLP